MANLLFRPSDLLSEIEALRGLAKSFLHPTSFQLEELAGDIRGLVTQKSGAITLEIPKNRPLRTRTSKGEFEPVSKSSNQQVYAEVTGKWEIVAAIHRLKSPSRPGRKAKPTLLIGFSGLASTVINVIDQRSEESVASWQMDIGDDRAPGCFFHTSACDPHQPPTTQNSKFPVPRHPNLFPTPWSAIGFTLGELFKDDWEHAVSGAADSPQRWRSIQSTRLTALLDWQLKLVTKATASPWLAIKMAKPPAEIFV